MKELVNHLVRQNLPQIAKQSLLDCHVRGMHSIMFLDTPEQRVRLFVATRYHELHLNTSRTLGSLAAHPHHCDITLHCIKGDLFNYTYEPHQDGKYKPFRYVSGILNEQAGFIRTPEEESVEFVGSACVRENNALVLPAKSIHSVHANKGEVTAWFVYEGKEDPSYTSLSYSDKPLQNTVFGDLYGKMTEQNVIELLQLAGLYNGKI